MEEVRSCYGRFKMLTEEQFNAKPQEFRDAYEDYYAYVRVENAREEDARQLKRVRDAMLKRTGKR